MNQGGYFGAYQSGFQTLPKYAYEMMTAPTQINGETIKKAASGIGSMVQKYADQKAGSEASQQGAAAQYSGLESMSQATGVPMNPVLSEQYKNIGNMSSQQQAVFNQSLGQEAQNMMARYNISQAKARAAQAAQSQGQGNYSSVLKSTIGQRTYSPTGASNPPIGYGGLNISNEGIANIMGQTGTGFKFLK